MIDLYSRDEWFRLTNIKDVYEMMCDTKHDYKINNWYDLLEFLKNNFDLTNEQKRIYILFRNDDIYITDELLFPLLSEFGIYHKKIDVLL